MKLRWGQFGYCRIWICCGVRVCIQGFGVDMLAVCCLDVGWYMKQVLKRSDWKIEGEIAEWSKCGDD